MDNFVKEVQVRWSDLDPNFHLRHSVYYDWGAFCRIEFLNLHGLNPDVMTKLNFGPILFREECVFRKEIRMNDLVTIDLKLIKAKKDFSRWSIQHTIIKGGDIPCAILTVEGAWMDTLKRKLTAPPLHIANIYEEMPRSKDFQLLD